MGQVNIKSLTAVSIIMLVISTGVSAQQWMSVTGRVVDRDGSALAGAIVTLLPAVRVVCEGCIDEVYGGFVTSDDGTFYVQSQLFEGQQARLVVSDPIPFDVWPALISPELDMALATMPEFRGLELVATGRTIQLGDIEPNIVYRRVSIDLGSAFRRTITLRDESVVQLSIKYKGKKVVDKMIVHERAIDRERNTLTFALPQGKWKVTVFLFQNGEKHAFTETYDLPHSGRQ